MEKKSNYDITLEQCAKRFIEYDQEYIISKFSLKHNENYIYIRFVGDEYGIDRNGGTIVRLDENGEYAAKATFEEAMSIYDMLCHSETKPVLAGKWTTISQLAGFIGSAHQDSSMLNKYTDFFAGKSKELAETCRKLGAKESKGGDVSFEIPMFTDFYTWFQFWDADDEFPASIRFLWDENALAFVHYETIWYMMGYLAGKMKNTIENHDQE